ncbi:DUF302 domain-containing protein [Hoeflea sp. YIM 152468]|uniref:DUF302 domain-containing protein n=1 Tax=Hoeflea sp. YIM 152468 TaxID=3031759 RepID=UPI0023DA2CDF|nr:DUF302 domain-containing protein [Hoeflea sp. YIM 152468]MDF1609516.1 DUF302 domain-containing protein [Hoeflea sp. YIM 152468]
MRALLAAIPLLLCLAAGAQAAGEDVKIIESDAAFADVASGIENAILNRGYKVDYHGFIGDMLKRTADDVDAEKALYTDAEFFTFCSAVLSRKVMEAEIGDIAYCPYVVFAYEAAETPGRVAVGFRLLPEGGQRDAVNALLSDIITDAAEGM